MPEAVDLPALLRDQALVTVLSRHRELRGAHWDALVRAVLSYREGVDPIVANEVAWADVALRDLDAPVTEEAVRAWLATRPAPAAVRWLGALFDVRDPRAVTRERLIRLAVEEHPDALTDLLPPGGVGPDPLERHLYALAGESLGAAFARRKLALPDGQFAGSLQFATVEARTTYLRETPAVITAYELGQLGRWLAADPGPVPDGVRAAYGAALAACVTRLRKHERHDLYPYTALLDAAAVEALLRAAAKRAGVFEVTLTRVVAQGHPQCAAGVAALLNDKKLGPVAALALASMGATGAEAARSVLDAATPKTAAAVERARTLLSLPPAPHPLWAGSQRSLPRFGRDPAVDLRAPTETPISPVAPTPLADLERALTEKPGADLLPPTGWADLVQILALDPFLANVPYAYERALRAGWLGLGADPNQLTYALDAVRWDSNVTKRYPASDWGLGWALLWAGADASVFRHAIARFELGRSADVLGARDRHFTDALREVNPTWAPQMLALLKHYGANRDETAWLGPPACLASIAEAAAEVSLPADTTSLWVLGRVQGASRFTVRVRGDVAVTIDVARERWSVSSPSRQEGATPPLDPARGVAFTIEMARDGMYLGVDGAAVHGAFMGLPMTVAPVVVTAEGDGARVTELALYEKFTARETEAAGTFFMGLDQAQGYAEVAGQRSASAAHLLAAAALLLDGPGAGFARDALLAMEGDAPEPWRQRVRDGALAPVEAPAKKPRKGAKADEAPAAPAGAPSDVTPPAAAFALRSFEDVVRVLHDLKLGVKPRSKKPAVLRRGQTEYNDLEYASYAPSPASEDWGARGAVPYPAVYLSEEGPSFDDVEAFVDAVSRLPALCRKGRGTAADVRACVDGDRYIVASMTVIPPDNGGYGDALWYEVMAAAWRVDEGWCWAVLEGDEAPLRQLIGVLALPAQVEWSAKQRVPVGNW